MGAPSYGKRKNQRREGTVSLAGMARTCGGLFLDSGAHSLYHEHTLGKPRAERYSWYIDPKRGLSKAFRDYMEEYAEFILQNEHGIDFYVTVDAIYNPEISWEATKYMVQLGLDPVPVIHHKTPMRWVDKYLEAGYKYLGVGGLGQESTRHSYTDWADEFYRLICPSPSYKPIAKTHGFAMTSYPLLLRYPWYSIDSASWAKAAGFGMILVPHKRNGNFTFDESPYAIGISCDSVAKCAQGQHYESLAPAERKIVREWLDFIDMPLGAVDDNRKTLKYGVRSEYNARAVANLKFFTTLCEWLPTWPWPFKARVKKGLLA